MAVIIIVPDRDTLSDSVSYLAHQDLIPLCKVALLSAFWDDPGPLFDKTRKQVSCYFEFFQEECRRTLDHWEKYNVDALTFRHLTNLAIMMRKGESRNTMENYLHKVLEGDCLIVLEDIIDLTVRLVLMVPIWSFWQGMGKGSGHTALTWVDGTISQAFKRHFRPRSRTSTGDDSKNFEVKPYVQLDKSLTAKNLEKRGLKIVWTDNMLDHLLYRSEDNTVCIFHHVSFLHYQKENEMYPPGLIKETLKTISLLLPSNDPETKEWFIGHHIEQHLDGEANKCRPLTKEGMGMENFDFWRDRLTLLKQAYTGAKSPPLQDLVRRFKHVRKLSNPK